MLAKKSDSQKKGNKNGIKKIEFTMMAPGAQHLFLSGDFNHWNTSSHPFKKGTDGKWKIIMELMPGRYEYRFLVNGEWRNDPHCAEFAPNPFGGENCIMTVK